MFGGVSFVGFALAIWRVLVFLILIVCYFEF